MCLPAARGYATTSVTNIPQSCHSCIGKVGTQSSQLTKSSKTQQALGSLLQESIPLWWNSQLSCAAKVTRCQWSSKVGEEVKTVKLKPYFFTRVVIDPATLWYNNKCFLCSVCKSPQDWRDCTKQLCKLGPEHERELLGLCEICYLGNSEANWCLYRWTLNPVTSVKSMQLKLTTWQLSRQWFCQYANTFLIIKVVIH